MEDYDLGTWSKYNVSWRAEVNRPSISHKGIEVEEDWLGSGFDIFTFYSKADRTKFYNMFKRIGVNEDLMLLSKEVVG